MGKEDRRFVIAVIVLAGLLRLYRLGGQSLWVDEILTYTVSSPKPGLNIWDYLKHNLHGPLHAVVVYVFHFVSQNDGWLRLPSAIAGTASVYVFYRWVDHWLSRKIARAAALLLAVHPLHIHYSQEMRNYSFLFFFGVTACFFLHRLVERDRGREYGGYVMSLALAALSNFTSAFLYVTHSVIFFVRRGIGRSTILRWFILSMIVLVLISPWVYRIYEVIDITALVTPVMPGELATDQRLRGETTVTLYSIPYTSFVFSVGFTLGPTLRELHREHRFAPVVKRHAVTVLWVGLLFGYLSLRGAWNLSRNRARLLEVALYLLVPVLLTLLLCWQNAKAFNIRYVLVAMPVYLCLLASALTASRGSAAVLLWIAVLATSGWSLRNHYFNEQFAKADVRGAANYLEARVVPGECILVPTVKEVFEHYYDRDTPLFKISAPKGTSRSRIEDQLVPLFATCNSFWYVRAREWVNDPDGLVLGVLHEQGEAVESIDFAGVTLIRFVEKNASPH